MNADAAVAVACSVADRVADAAARQSPVLVLGGDCTVELGTVAGALRQSERVGLIYVDLDVDLNTPESTTDGALDWMGVAHMLRLHGDGSFARWTWTAHANAATEQVLFFGHANVTEPERRAIDALRIAECPLSKVAAYPAGIARASIEDWARAFDLLLIHLDVDVLDYIDMPLAENTLTQRWAALCRPDPCAGGSLDRTQLGRTPPCARSTLIMAQPMDPPFGSSQKPWHRRWPARRDCEPVNR